MAAFVISLHETPQAALGSVGGKAAPLALLATAGFPIPPGLCVTTTAFELALASRQSQLNAILNEHDLIDPADAGAAAQRVDRLLTGLTAPEPVANALAAAWPRAIGTGVAVAVRSSATSEDRAGASYAGQYATVLGVRDQDNVLAAIVTCWRSFFTAHALAARASHGDLQNNEAMAVLIMPVIEAECAGVCWSIDPIQERRDRIVVNATWGLGASVADGSLPADTAWIRRNGLEIEQRHVVEKQEQLVLDAQGNLQVVSVDPARRRVACLPDPWLRQVAQMSIAAELQFGSPQDVEWAIAQEQIWLLQSRPIASLPPRLARTPEFPVQWEDEQERHRLWTLTYPESRGDALLPLEQDEITEVERVREETCRFMGAERNQLMKVCNGRIYTTPVPIDWPEGDRRVRQAAMQDLRERLHRQDQTAWDYWGPEIVSATERLRSFDTGAANDAALAEHLAEAIAVRRRHFMLHPLCWFNPPRAYFAAFESVSGLAGPAAEAAAYALLDGEETPLTRLVDGLYELALVAREIPAVAALVANPPPNVLGRLAGLPQAATFRTHLDNFLVLYGERTGNGYGSEATIQTPTWHEQPQAVLQLLAPYLDPDVEPPVQARRRARQASDAQVETLCRSSEDGEAVACFRRELAYARKTLAVLEIHNHYIDQMAIGQLRRAVLAAADRLVEKSMLATQEDVCWLTFDEIQSALRSDHSPGFVTTIADRRTQHAAWQKLEAPPILGVPNARLPERPAQQDDLAQTSDVEPGRIVGLGASPGHLRGRARVVPMSALRPAVSPGDILVAENAGPLWTPLFPILGGLILDGGSLGQHAVATAREYGIPAVIHTGRATRSIPDGTWVTMDGAAGTVVLEA